MNIVSHKEGNCLQVSLTGKLTFSENSAFQAITTMQEDSNVRQINISLDNLEYIDSSGIGMLLVLKEKCDELGAAMTLSHPKGQVAKILRIACIEKVIPIVP